MNGFACVTGHGKVTSIERLPDYCNIKDIMVCSSHGFGYAVIQGSYEVDCIPVNGTKPIIK